MKPSCSSRYSAIRGAWRRLLAAPLGAALLLLAACNGTAVVTMTSTPSPDNFLAYRVALVSVQLEASSGTSGLKVLPASTSVDFATLTDVSEVLGAAAVAKGSYKSALITLDYSSAQIVYDDGSVNGVALTPVGANGQALGQVALTVNLDPSDPFRVTSNKSAQLALDFSLAASNVVNLTSKTVTVTPMIAASAMPIDAKQVRIRGPLASVAGSSVSATTDGSFKMGVMPFNGSASGAGTLPIVLTAATTYEINGNVSTGSAGQGQLVALGVDTLCVAYGTLTTADETTTTTTLSGVTTTTGSSNVSFTATQVLAGSSVQGAGLDRVTGIVTARSGDTLTVEDGTLVANDGSETFVGGTTFVSLGPNTLVTVFGQGVPETIGPQQLSVGSAIDAFGVATSQGADNMVLDASAGHVRESNSNASGLVTAQGTGTLDLALVSLGGRAVAAFDFAGTGAAAGQFVVNTAALDLTNSTVGAPVIATGIPNLFGVAPPDFSASALLDPTTIQAQVVVDWGTGTAAPFVTYDSSAIDLDVHNSNIGARHEIQLGAQPIDLFSLSSDPSIVPNPTASTAVFAIGHAASSTIENFITYAAFVTQLQTELNGTILATGMTAVGQYTVSSFSFTATSITVLLNN
jgi:hypothetical protein